MSSRRQSKPPLKPWSMCSSLEASDRSQTRELSIFESHPNTHPTQQPSSTSSSSGMSSLARATIKYKSKPPTPDPYRCIQKYRRSAAGGGVSKSNSSSSSRSMDELELTLDYLLSFIYPQQYSSSSMPIQTLVSTVQFIDDRIRAIQVDISTILGNVNNNNTNITTTSSFKYLQLLQRIRNMEMKICRYNLLTHYLLSNVDAKKYEWKFAKTALTTAISIYLDTCGRTNSYYSTLNSSTSTTTTTTTSSNKKNEELLQLDIEEKDEMMSYIALLHIATVLQSREGALPTTPTSMRPTCGLLSEDGEGISALLGLYKRYCPSSQENEIQRQKIQQQKTELKRRKEHEPELIEEEEERNTDTYPKWKWALQIASLVETGNYLAVLRLLAACNHNNHDHDHPSGSTSLQQSQNSSNKVSDLDLTLSDELRWNILCRCCIAQVLPVIRIGLIRLYNKSFGGKQEKVSAADVSRLLHLPTNESAIQFCQRISLPTTKSTSSSSKSSTTEQEQASESSLRQEQQHDRVIMKVAPISITEDSIPLMTHPGRSEDVFVFGHHHASLWLQQNNVHSSSNRNEDRPKMNMIQKKEDSSTNSDDPGDTSTAQNTPSSPSNNNNNSSSNVQNHDTSYISWADMSDSEDEEEDDFEICQEEYHDLKDSMGTFTARVDRDGVKILPSPIMWQLIGYAIEDH